MNSNIDNSKRKVSPSACDKSELTDIRQKFEEKLWTLKLSVNSHLIENAQKYEALILEVEAAKSRNRKIPADYRRMKRYDVIISADGTKQLIQPSTNNEGSVIVYAHNEQLFDIIHKSHMETEHGGKHKMDKYIKGKYANVTRETIIMYLQVCPKCQERRMQYREAVAVKAKIKDVNFIGKISLIDMQDKKNDDYQFILDYQEYSTRFRCLRPLKARSTAEIAHNLIDVFYMIGAPAVFQCSEGKEIGEGIKEELNKIWPYFEIKHEEALSSDTEIYNQGVREMIAEWLTINKTSRWSEGLRFCQWQHNSSFDYEINRTPYQAMFGRTYNFATQTSRPFERVDLENEVYTIEMNPATEGREKDLAVSQYDLSALQNITPINIESHRLSHLCKVEERSSYPCRKREGVAKPECDPNLSNVVDCHSNSGDGTTDESNSTCTKRQKLESNPQTTGEINSLDVPVCPKFRQTRMPLKAATETSSWCDSVVTKLNEFDDSTKICLMNQIDNYISCAQLHRMKCEKEGEKFSVHAIQPLFEVQTTTSECCKFGVKEEILDLPDDV